MVEANRSQTATPAARSEAEYSESVQMGAHGKPCLAHEVGGTPEALPGILVLAQVHELRTISVVNMVLAMFSVAFLAVNIVCIVLNSSQLECEPQDAECDPVTSKELFHRLEFWATFAFNVLDVVALAYSPKRLSAIFWNPFILRMVMFLNISGSLISALLITINLEKFEVPAHELEYSNELTMAFCDLVILASLIRGLRTNGVKRQKRSFLPSLLMVLLAGCVALVQLGIYNLSGWDGSESRGEKAAHYCEFAFGIISSGITFWFTMDNKFIADTTLARIMSPEAARRRLWETANEKFDATCSDSVQC